MLIFFKSADNLFFMNFHIYSDSFFYNLPQNYFFKNNVNNIIPYEILSVIIIDQTNHLTVLLPLLIFIPPGAQLIRMGSFESYLSQNGTAFSFSMFV